MIKKPAIVLLLAMLQLAAYAQQTYQLDIKKSKILWNARKTMGGHYGYLLFNSGRLNYSPSGEPANGVFSLNMNSMRSTDHDKAADNQKVDERLKTEGFFAMARYPAATMNVKQIVRIGKSINFKVAGDLTMKGITNPIEFTAVILEKRNTINVTAELKIDRIKWNIDLQTDPKSLNYFAAMESKLITDEIAVSLNLVFNK